MEAKVLVARKLAEGDRMRYGMVAFVWCMFMLSATTPLRVEAKF